MTFCKVSEAGGAVESRRRVDGLPTKVPRLRASTSLMKLNMPATKPRKMMPKWTKGPTRRKRKKMVDLARVMADR